MRTSLSFVRELVFFMEEFFLTSEHCSSNGITFSRPSVPCRQFPQLVSAHGLTAPTPSLADCPNLRGKRISVDSWAQLLSNCPRVRARPFLSEGRHWLTVSHILLIRPSLSSSFYLNPYASLDSGFQARSLIGQSRMAQERCHAVRSMWRNLSVFRIKICEALSCRTKRGRYAFLVEHKQRTWQKGKGRARVHTDWRSVTTLVQMRTNHL